MKTKSIIFTLLAFIAFNLNAKSYKVKNITEFDQQVKTISAGDSIILANGIWKNVEIKFKGEGKEGKFIYLTAETRGKVTIEGASRLQLSGKYLHISGLVFVNGYTPKSTVLEFRTSSKDYAYNSVVSECVIDKYNQLSKDSSDHWVGMWGQNNSIEYCYFGGKANAGTTLVVWPNDSNSIHNNHHIYRNYFGPRPRLGSNGGETIRIGTSQVCRNSSETIVEGNYFEHCNGETEIISNKSTNNKFYNNTFYECEGSLVMRHGDNGTVVGNWFIGNGKVATGGVRVINSGHIIYNNFFYKLRGDDFRSSLAIMNGIPNSPDNGYVGVKNVIVANNTYYDCAAPWAFGVGVNERNRSVRPENVLLLNNLVYCPAVTELIKRFDQTDGIKLDNNLMVDINGNSTESGTIAGEILNKEVWGMNVPYTTAKAKKLPFVKYDILGQIRTAPVVGAFQEIGETANIELATSKNCGPSWYQSLASIAENIKTEPKIISVAQGSDNIYQALKKAQSGDILELEAGEHLVTKKISINKNIEIRSKDAKATITANFDRENANIFEISENAILRFDNVNINGNDKSKYPAKYGITSSKENAFGYHLIINNCNIYGFNVETGAIFKANKGSFADSIIISNSNLSNSFRGLSLGDEKDNNGLYNAEYIKLYNSTFSNIKQYVIDYYRGGTDESTLGGSLDIDHCVFDYCANDEKQTMLKTSGIVSVNIMNSIFNNSLAKTLVKLSGNKNSISFCAINNCEDPKVVAGARSFNIIIANPKFEKKSFKLSKKSKLLRKASDGANIGLK